VTWPDRPPPNMMERARDELARRAEAQHPGWVLRHGIYGWTATRACDGLTRSSSSLPGLRPLMTSADTLDPALNCRP
jgi:hypothetical protein